MRLLVDTGKDAIRYFGRRIEIDSAIQMLNCAIAVADRRQPGGKIRLILRGIRVDRGYSLKYPKRLPAHAFSQINDAHPGQNRGVARKGISG